MWVGFLSDDPYHITWKEKFGSKPLKRENQPKIFQSPSHRIKLYQLPFKKGKSNAHPVCQSAILRTPHLTNNRGKKCNLFFHKGKHSEKVGKWTKILFKTYPFWKIPEIHMIKSNPLDLAITKILDSNKKDASQARRWGSCTPKILAPKKKNIHVLQLIAWSLSGSIRLLLISSQRYLGFQVGFSGVSPGFF